MSPRPDVTEERTAQILDAAMHVFARLGFYRARMDDIVAESGLSKGAIYWYFKSKDEIIFALVERIFTAELAALQQSLAEDTPALDRMERFLQGVVGDFQQMEAFTPVMMEAYAEAARQERFRETMAEYYRSFRQVIASLVNQGIARGEFRAVEAESAAVTITAMMEGMGLLWMIDPGLGSFEQLATGAWDLLLRGLLVEA